MSTPTTAAKKATPSRPTTVKAETSTAAASSPVKTLADHLSTLSEGDVMSPEGLHAFLEAMRALTTGLAFFAEAASTQIESAMRRGARDNSADGRLTLAEKAKLKLVLRRVNRNMETLIKDALLDSARGSVKTYAVMQEFLDELESTQVSRPHRRSSGGFNLFSS